MKIKFFILTLLVSFQALIAEPTLEDQVKAAKNPDYYIHVAHVYHDLEQNQSQPIQN